MILPRISKKFDSIGNGGTPKRLFSTPIRFCAMKEPLWTRAQRDTDDQP